LSAVFPHETVMLTKGPGGWIAAGAPLLASSADGALTAILDLKSRPFLEEKETPGLQSGRPVARRTVQLSAREPRATDLLPPRRPRRDRERETRRIRSRRRRCHPAAGGAAQVRPGSRPDAGRVEGDPRADEEAVAPSVSRSGAGAVCRPAPRARRCASCGACP